MLFNVGMHATGCMIADFQGHRLILNEGGTTTFVSCDFLQNRLTSDTNGAAVIEAGAHNVFAGRAPSEVWHALHESATAVVPVHFVVLRCSGSDK